MVAVPDGDEALRLMAQLEDLLREHHAQGRCCRTDCLHCPYGRESAWALWAQAGTDDKQVTSQPERQTPEVELEFNEADGSGAVAVLLHPHPKFGGDRFHPFVDGLFRALPPAGVTAVRFDFSSGDLDASRRLTVSAIDSALDRQPERPVVLVGYSFGAGVAAGIADDRVAGWYLLAPPATMLPAVVIGADPRPKALVVPASDQFSPPAQVREAVAGWNATTVTELSGADHFLGAAVDRAVADAMAWTVGALSGTVRPGWPTSSGSLPPAPKVSPSSPKVHFGHEIR